jgi:hypothetical protein
MINEYIVHYFIGKMKIQYGRMANERFCTYVSAHDEEEAKKLAKIQIKYGQGKGGEINILDVVPRIIDD